MIGEKLYNNISALTSLELNSCVRFSRNSFFNKRKEVTDTFELFKKNKNRFFSLLNDEEKLFFLLFKEEKEFKRRLLLDHFHYCMNMFEDFIVYNKSQNKEKRLELLEEFYNEKRLEKEFLAVNKKRILIEESKKINIDSNLKLYQLHKDKFYFLVKSFDNEVFKEIDIAVDYLDRYYILSKVNVFQELSSNTKMNNVEYNHFLNDEIFETIKNESLVNKDLLYEIYKYTIQLYKDDFDLKRYKILKGLVFNNIELFDIKLKKTILADLSNYVSYMYNDNADNALIQESFDIIKTQIENKTMIKNNTFPESTFSQDVRIAVYLKEYKWAESFIETHKKYIKNKDVVLVSKAEILYSQLKYNELYELIEEMSKSKKIENYNLKCLYVKALYDEGKFDLVSTYLNSFSKSLLRKKTNSKKLLASKQDFILYLGRMIKHMYSQTNLEKIEKQLVKNKHVFHRNWLIARLNLLLKKK